MRQQISTGRYSLPYTVRSERAALIVIFFLGIIISLLLLSLIQRGPSAILPVLLLLCIVWGFIGTWMLNVVSKRIVLLPDRICYRTLFSQHEMRFEHITRVELERVRRKGYRTNRVVRYFLRIDDNSSDKPLLINTKPFSKKNLAIVVDAIATHALSATFNDDVRQIGEDTFRG
jgi:hypothetical protein